MNIEDIYISLTIRHLQKEISEEEKHELFSWVYEKPENEKLFYNLKDIWETAQYKNVTKDAETESEWKKLALAAINKESEKFHKKKSSSHYFYKAIRIAAIVIIAFGIGFFVQEYIPKDVKYAEVNVPYGAKSIFKLPGGSSIWVNSGSTLKYPININKGKEINLYLEGEAFFEIAKVPNRKLNVITSTLNIQVLGTTFNVKSYNDDDIVETTLLEGSISITGKVGECVIKEPILLKPNEQATLTKSQSSVDIDLISEKSNSPSDKNQTSENVKKITPKSKPRLKIIEGIDVEQFISWKNNVLEFRNERFEELAKKLERWYNVEIIIDNTELKNSRYTGTFEKETVEQAIEALSLSLPFKYKMNKNKIEIISKTK
jgi:transmembrane sensor